MLLFSGHRQAKIKIKQIFNQNVVIIYEYIPKCTLKDVYTLKH